MAEFLADASGFDPTAYLDRIGHVGGVEISASGLESVHRAQAYTIAFENFDILLGRSIDLTSAGIFGKLVNHERGGYCFELNGLLLMALRAFGFDVRPLLARVHISGSPSGRGHMLLLVTLDGRQWIADVGFGGPGLRAPIPCELGCEVHQDGLCFRLVDAEPYGVMLQTRSDAAWQNLYSFDLGPVYAQDIEMGNHFTSTHPSSFFTYRRVAVLPRPDGRVSLYDLRLTSTVQGVVRERELEPGQLFITAIRAEFGIDLDADYDAIRPLASPRR